MRAAYRRRVLTAPSHDSLAEGDRALLAGDWARAQAAFESVLAAGTSPEAWDGVAWAAWWQADEPLTLRARETAYRGYRAVGNHRAAGNVAAWLASDYREFRGETAVAAGWLRRAHRLLDPLPESAAHGWLAVNEVSFVFDSTADAAAASGLAERAARIGREHGVADLEAVGLAQQGITAVVQGRVEEGMRLLDEASVVASGEDLQTPLSRGWALCYLIAACDGVGDFPRAAEWCHAMREVGERWGSRQLVGVCRASYGRVLATSGDWVGAEGELLAAVGDLEASRPAQAPRGLARLGELRARQGRTDEARSLFERSGSAGVLGLGELALDAGDADGAADAAERVLRRLPAAALLTRVPALELLVRARAGQGRVEDAAAVCEELARAGAQLGTPYVLGRVRLAAARVAYAAGDLEEARRASEDAVDRLSDGGAPYDAAVARLELARALTELGRRDAAAPEASAARDAFAALGAARELERADALLAGEAPPAAEEPPAAAITDLSPREVEVLRLIAEGLGDTEIAAHLVLSRHTVHRHVANVRSKLRLPSRTAAVAYAARAGLL